MTSHQSHGGWKKKKKKKKIKYCQFMPNDTPFDIGRWLIYMYIEDIQVFGVNMSFISLSEVKIFYIS